MIQLVINTNMLREIDENKLINYYSRLYYWNKKDITDDNKIRLNLENLFDWDANGDNGLGIFCSKFESIKRKDWEILIQFIKNNGSIIKEKAKPFLNRKREENKKIILSKYQQKKKAEIEYLKSDNYKATTSGKPAKSCIYEGRIYKSRKECMAKEGIDNFKLYEYLHKTGQV